MLNPDAIKSLVQKGLLSEIDIHFAKFISGFSIPEDPDIFLAAAMVSHATGNGDICLNLEAAAGNSLTDRPQDREGIQCPELEFWLKKLKAHQTVGSPGQFRPLILDEKNRLYLYRYWEYEKRLTDLIRSRTRNDAAKIDTGKLKGHLDALFPETGDPGMDWQKLAAAVAVMKRFCVISGGPGTGKTHAIARILAALIRQHHPDGLRIRLAAPTGKAAARLAESIGHAKRVLVRDSRILEAIPDTGSTIHRLLKPVKDSSYFTYNRDNPLPADVVVVDEVSMVDLPLMSKLIQALPEASRLILIGDRHQLASVQAGSVLGDICGGKIGNDFSESFARVLAPVMGGNPKQLSGPDEEKSGIRDCIVYFTRSYRFEKESGIDLLSRASILICCLGQEFFFKYITNIHVLQINFS